MYVHSLPRRSLALPPLTHTRAHTPPAHTAPHTPTPTPTHTRQFWVWSLYDAMRAGRAGIRPVAPARIATEAGPRGAGRFACTPLKNKF
jgi:hypothetical protein